MARSVDEAHASSCPRRAPRTRKLGSRSDARHSPRLGRGDGPDADRPAPRRSRCEPLPGAQERFVGDLDGRLSPKAPDRTSTEHVDDSIDEPRVDLQRVELASPNAAPRVLFLHPASRVEGRLASWFALQGWWLRRCARPEPIGPRDPADLVVRSQRESVTVPALEQFREPVLEQRQGARLMGDVGDDLGKYARLDRRRRLRRAAGWPVPSRPAPKGHHLRRGGKDLPEARVDERGDRRSRRAGSRSAAACSPDRPSPLEGLQEHLALMLVGGEREDLLELVHHQDEAGRKDDPSHPADLAIPDRAGRGVARSGA